MLNIKIESKRYSIPSQWSDITFNEYKKINDISKEMPSCLTKEVTKEEQVEVFEKNEFEIIRFYGRYLSVISGIEEEVIKSIQLLKDDNGIGLIELYGVVCKFLYMPEGIDALHSFSFKEKKYKCADIDFTAMGEKTYIKNISFGEYEEAYAARYLTQKVSGGDIDFMPLLVASLFREANGLFKLKAKKYSEKEAKDNAELFKELTMDKIWGCYFFLNILKQKYLESLRSYSLEESQAEGSQTGGYTLLKSKWLKKIFSRRKENLESKVLRNQN